MGTIYSSPTEVGNPPSYSGGDYKKHEKDIDKWVKSVVNWAKKNSNCLEAGKIIRFGVADGYAQYVVFAIKPVKLIHLDIYDGYEMRYAHRLTSDDVRAKIKEQETLERFFGKQV